MVDLSVGKEPQTMTTPLTSRPIDLIVAIILVALVSGCASPPAPSANEPDASCEQYETVNELVVKWHEETNESRPGWVSVPLVAGGWRLDRHEMPSEEVPSAFVDWDSYPVDLRPPILEDALCHGAYLVETYPDGSQTFASRVLAPEWMVHQTLENVTAEHERQTGIALDWRSSQWPFVLFEDHFYEVWCQGYHKRMENGSVEVVCPPPHEDR